MAKSIGHPAVKQKNKGSSPPWPENNLELKHLTGLCILADKHLTDKIFGRLTFGDKL